MSRPAEDWKALRHLSSDRDIYVISPIDASHLTQTAEEGENKASEADAISTTQVDATDYSCVICMEDLTAAEARQHYCKCVMCPGCLERSVEHHDNVGSSSMDDGMMMDYAEDRCAYIKDINQKICEIEIDLSVFSSGIPKGYIKCPGCREIVNPETDFLSPDQV